MKISINKDTKIYGSFSQSPGNNGCQFFNGAFEKYGIDAIYKSFYSDDIEKTILSVKHLNFSGFALSQPFKLSIVPYLDIVDDSVKNIGSCNTVLIEDGKLRGFNTDWVGAEHFLKNIDDEILIAGDGGFSKSVQYICNLKNIPYKIITRKNWEELSKFKGIIFNATPVGIDSNGYVIDARPHTQIGKHIAKLQAIEQFKIYTGIDYEGND